MPVFHNIQKLTVPTSSPASSIISRAPGAIQNLWRNHPVTCFACLSAVRRIQFGRTPDAVVSYFEWRAAGSQTSRSTFNPLRLTLRAQPRSGEGRIKTLLPTRRLGRLRFDWRYHTSTGPFGTGILSRRATPGSCMNEATSGGGSKRDCKRPSSSRNCFRQSR